MLRWIKHYRSASALTQQYNKQTALQSTSDELQHDSQICVFIFKIRKNNSIVNMWKMLILI